MFGLELEMQVELLKLDKNDEIDTLEQCIAAACEIHGEPHMPRQVVQNFYGYGVGAAAKSTMVGAGAIGSASGVGGPNGFGCVAMYGVCDFSFAGECAV